MERYVEARSSYLEALRLEPDLAPAQAHLGLTLLRDGQLVNTTPRFPGGILAIPDLNMGLASPQGGAPIPDGTYSYSAVERSLTED